MYRALDLLSSVLSMCSLEVSLESRMRPIFFCVCMSSVMLSIVLFSAGSGVKRVKVIVSKLSMMLVQAWVQRAGMFAYMCAFAVSMLMCVV